MNVLFHIRTTWPEPPTPGSCDLAHISLWSGEVVWTGDDAFGVISRAKTERQKFQRAFAQSLLCPFEDLLEHIDPVDPTDDQIEAAANQFDVRQSVVQTLLVNKGVLPRETLAERLESA